MSGYVRLHRDLLAHPAFRNDAEAMAFAWMFVRAAWKPGRVRYKGHAIDLKRGQLAVSIRDMAEALDRDKAWVERLFKRLRAETMIETRAETGVSVITICNYAKYQPCADTPKTPSETPDEADARQARDTEQEREESKKEEITPPTPRAGGRRGKTLLPRDWVIPSVDELPPRAKACAALWSAESYATHGEAFSSYWHGEGKMKTDWRDTWANRVVALHSQVMRDQKFGNAPPVASHGRANAAANPNAAQISELYRAHKAGEIDFDTYMARKTPLLEIETTGPDARRRSKAAPARGIGDLIQRMGMG